MNGLLLGILPCRGRKQITIECVTRLVYTASLETYPWKLVAVSGKEDRDIVKAVSKLGAIPLVDENRDKLTYWEALQFATDTFTEFPLLANLANDILPCGNWLQRGLIAYDRVIGRNEQGLVGFNGDSHGPEDACHFIIHRELLKKYGGWPTWYNHNFGDAELCARAIEDKKYHKEPWAILYHNHAYFYGEERNDNIYREGRKFEKEDAELYRKRKADGWPALKEEIPEIKFAFNFEPVTVSYT